MEWSQSDHVEQKLQPVGLIEPVVVVEVELYSCGPYPIHGLARLAFKMEGKCEKKMWVDFRVLENPSQMRNGFALESPLTFIFIFKWGKPSKNKKPQ